MKKKKILWISLFSILILSTKVESTGEIPLYNIENDSKAFASYSKGLVYIGNEDFLANVSDEIQENDVAILDERNNSDPNVKVISSYQVNTKRDKKEILNIISLYEEMNPSDWDRSYSSMLKEWEFHNLLHSLGYELHRTTDVDFNNKDEDTYRENVLEIVLKVR